MEDLFLLFVDFFNHRNQESQTVLVGEFSSEQEFLVIVVSKAARSPFPTQIHPQLQNPTHGAKTSEETRCLWMSSHQQFRYHRCHRKSLQ